MNTKLTFLFVFLLGSSLFGQTSSEDQMVLKIKEIFEFSQKQGQAYTWLEELCLGVGPRITGSKGHHLAEQWAKATLKSIGINRVHGQKVRVHHWQRLQERTDLLIDGKRHPLNALSLGGSISTPPSGIRGTVVEVQEFEELAHMDTAALSDQIVFFNRPLDPGHFDTFKAYGGAVAQRVYGANEAAKYGAKAVLVRSMASGINEFPHTGSMYYKEGIKRIPAMAISTADAESLSDLLEKQKVEVEIFSQTRIDSSWDQNIIAEIPGSTYPDEIILVGGHLDSWDVGHGAHDDGTGCVQAMQVMQWIMESGYQPKRTIRCVLFANEESGLKGGLAYAKRSNELNEKHIAAIESDRGGFTPQALGIGGSGTKYLTKLKKVMAWSTFFNPYGIQLRSGGGGADINPLKSQEALLIGLIPDSNRYFDFHHSEADVFDAVHERELKAGAFAMTALVYLLDQYGTN